MSPGPKSVTIPQAETVSSSPSSAISMKRVRGPSSAAQSKKSTISTRNIYAPQTTAEMSTRLRTLLSSSSMTNTSIQTRRTAWSAATPQTTKTQMAKSRWNRHSSRSRPPSRCSSLWSNYPWLQLKRLGLTAPRSAPFHLSRKLWFPISRIRTLPLSRSRTREHPSGKGSDSER